METAQPRPRGVHRLAHGLERAPVIIQHAWSKLTCMVYGHYYHPCYIECGSLAQYECQCCGELTKWMTKKEHDVFNLVVCPTWGERGSDSQNYRFIGPPERINKRYRPRKGRRRYKK